MVTNTTAKLKWSVCHWARSRPSNVHPISLATRPEGATNITTPLINTTIELSKIKRVTNPRQFGRRGRGGCVGDFSVADIALLNPIQPGDSYHPTLRHVGESIQRALSPRSLAYPDAPDGTNTIHCSRTLPGGARFTPGLFFDRLVNPNANHQQRKQDKDDGERALQENHRSVFREQ